MIKTACSFEPPSVGSSREKQTNVNVWE